MVGQLRLFSCSRSHLDPKESIQGTVGMPCSLHASSAGASREITMWGRPSRLRCAAQFRISRE